MNTKSFRYNSLERRRPRAKKAVTDTTFIRVRGPKVLNDTYKKRGGVRYCVRSKTQQARSVFPRITGRRAGAGKETPVTNAQRLHLSDSVRFIESRVPADSQLKSSGGMGPTSHLVPFTPKGAPLEV